MNFTRAEFEQDRERYWRELDLLAAAGLTVGHPLVDRLIRRIEVVNRILADPRFGLTEEAPNGPADPA